MLYELPWIKNILQILQYSEDVKNAWKKLEEDHWIVKKICKFHLGYKFY